MNDDVDNLVSEEKVNTKSDLDSFKQQLYTKSIVDLEKEESELQKELENLKKKKEILRRSMRLSGHTTNMQGSDDIDISTSADFQIGNSSPASPSAEATSYSEGNILNLRQTDKQNTLIISQLNNKPLSALTTEEKELLRPCWKRDDSVLSCESCHRRFSIRRRRHHCRNCGGIFCNGCMKRQSLPRLNYNTPVRVCIGCLLEIMADKK
eukprot:TRINITY_DN1252_c0_g1_i2.p1 TRINITY_DN1252_c0_g1~~TRINITY_DN1252_c0_g1_i2.p1  ORF type:complete len:209 (-),score=19.14 TRINITY_DN1252_c0_g1_i2:113-739(-)